MASIHLNTNSPYYRIRFRHDGRNVSRSLKTSDKRRARALCSQVEETIDLVSRGRLVIPAGVDALEYILAGGQPATKVTQPQTVSLTDLFKTYEENLPVGRKEESTLVSERIHVKHLKKYLGPNRTVQTITKAVLQGYVAKRLKSSWHGKSITSDTIRNELVTFRMLWNWGVKEGLLTGESPTKDVDLPLTDEKPPFMTRDEIEKMISRGGLNADKEKELWEALYLHVSEVSQVLDVIKQSARYPFIFPMIVFICHTGCRRSEMVRSRIEDIDFATKTVLLREKKKSRKKAVTFRRVDMSPLLCEVMQNWLANHPGGQHTFAQPRRSGEAEPLTADQAHHHFKQTLSKTDWKVIKGFHVFRHSFASNLAAAGVDQRVIDEFMGHQTEEMRRRYRHLFPQLKRSAIASVFGGKEQQTMVSVAS